MCGGALARPVQAGRRNEASAAHPRMARQRHVSLVAALVLAFVQVSWSGASAAPSIPTEVVPTGRIAAWQRDIVRRKALGRRTGHAETQRLRGGGDPPGRGDWGGQPPGNDQYHNGEFQPGWGYPPPPPPPEAPGDGAGGMWGGRGAQYGPSSRGGFRGRGADGGEWRGGVRQGAPAAAP